MLQHNLFKVLQRKTYSCLSHKYGIYFAYTGLIIVIYSMFHFGEEVLEWSRYHYEIAFSVYHDNIVSQSFQHKLCSELPVDAVYTWVNGSDPNLLAQIKYFSMKASIDDDTSVESVCKVKNCFQLPIVVVTPKISEDQLNFSYIHSKQISEDLQFLPNSSIVRFESTNEAIQFFSNFTNHNYFQSLIYVTTDVGGSEFHQLNHALILKDFPSQIKTGQQLADYLPISLYKKIAWIYMYNNVFGFVLLKKKFTAKKIIEKYNNTDGLTGLKVGNTYISMHFVYYLKFNHSYEKIKSIASKSRFEDNEELRYSLRSLEKYAPWIRHVYIVTNGQIPYWLNMDSPLLTVVTHDEIFVNKSHLPTFSSPAIETHLHRIPGLSSRFIYFNDDVMFGKEVWPEDFYSHLSGYKVYLSWPVPNCAEGCTPSWITDGYCDAACNVSACNWDGGDCIGPNIRAGVGLSSNNNRNMWQSSFSHYCTPGCSNSWLADKFCDQACNVIQCGFDAGDCGLSNFDQLHLITSNLKNDSFYYIPDGENVGYIELKTTFSKVLSAQHEKEDCVRVAAVSNKFHVLTVIFSKACNKTEVQFYVGGFLGNATNVNISEIYQFKLEAFPSRNVTKTIRKKLSENVSEDFPTTPNIMPHSLPSFSALIKKPQIQTNKKLIDYPSNFSTNDINENALPLKLKQKVKQLKIEFDMGLITDDGLKYLLYNLTKLYLPSRKMLPKQSIKLNGNANGIMEESHSHRKGDPGTIFNGLTVDHSNNLRKKINHSIKLRKLNWKTHQNQSILQFKAIDEHYEIKFQQRKLLDIFGDSLRFVSNLYNQRFGFSQRKVPAHMPHMIDREIMINLQSKYPSEFDITSSHRFRDAEDMQFAFSYFYFLMSEKKELNMSQIFDDFDVDNSGILSDREIRLLATKIYKLPLTLQEITSLEEALKNCAQKLYGSHDNSTWKENTTYWYKQPLKGLEISEIYYDKSMPLVTKEIVLNCSFFVDQFNKTFGRQTRFKFQEMPQTEIVFKMIGDNVSTVIGQLDDVRQNPKKFICLNDNINHDLESAATIRAVLHDFYETLFPKPSRFELRPDHRNRFEYVADLHAWKAHHERVIRTMHIFLTCLLVCVVVSFFSDKLSRTCRRLKYAIYRKSLLRCFVGKPSRNPV